MESLSNPVPSIIPSGAGVVHGRKYIKLFIPRTSTKNLNSHTFTIGAKINGMKNTGFNTNGPPNSIGSFTPNAVGIHEALPMALFCFDFASHINMKGTTRVAPVPPIVVTNICRPGVITLEACAPACSDCRLDSRLMNAIADMAGSTMDGPCIPTNQNRAITPYIIVIPIYPSAALNKGFNDSIKAWAKLYPNVFLTSKSMLYRINTVMLNGITSLKVCDKFGGTSLGILIVIFLPMQNL